MCIRDRCTAAASHAETLVDDLGHQVTEAGACVLRCHHEGLQVCSRKVLLFLGSLEKQVCHDRDVPDQLRGRCASGDEHVDLDQVANGQECLVCRLVLLATAGEPGDVAVAGAATECHDNC